MAMKVVLAGYNVDSTVIEELKNASPSRNDITPETLSASYARISRDPRPIDELRAEARAEVERARRSNQNIIFGMGHHSVAEHAVFNFDIIGVSRLALEEIEKFRLISYTEKSQRYVTLKNDFVLPEEIRAAGFQKIFIDTIQAQNALYHKLYKRLQPHIFGKHKDMAEDPKKHSLLKGWAKEDARYVVSLSTQGQVGMTSNARNLEFFIRRFSAQRLTELRELNQKIYKLAKEVAPSIILFTEAADFDAKTYRDLERGAGDSISPKNEVGDEAVQLMTYSHDADDHILAALLHRSSSLSYKTCLKNIRRLSQERKKEFLKLAFRYMEFYDSVLREFEYVSLTFDLIISATCFAQLKRHRMATITTQKYNPALGVTVPPSIEEIGMKEEFLEIMDRTNDVYSRLNERLEQGAEYVLTNAHRKRVLIKVNARELYHISRLREDRTAQWDIRQVIGKMTELARKVMPLTFLLIGSKDNYSDVYKEVFGRRPKLDPPDL
jgi:flavin-dependent thymidylate synthase